MKGILIVDMPKCCLDCPCSFTYANVKGTITNDVCEAAEDRQLSKENMNEEKPMWCPLKPMPSKMKVDYDTISLCEVTEKVVAMGFNACVEILSETETWHSMQGNLEMPKGLFDKIYEDGEKE